jgi:glycosyltransferase involved in cell wall biosynthesis
MQASQPTFSIIIPTYNRADLIRETLDSVFAQDFTDFEVIVVDDGSTDNTAEIIGSYGARIRTFRQANSGPGAARNLGVSAARGRYVAFLDSDDLWFSWTLQTYWQVTQQFGEPAVVMGAAYYWTSRDELNSIASEALEVEAFKDYLATSSTNFLRTACSIIVKTSDFKSVGGFAANRINSEDHDLLYRLGVSGQFILIKHPAVLAYRQHPGSQSQDLSDENLGQSYDGLLYHLSQDQDGAYPGGAARRLERRRLLAFGTRHVSRLLLHHGQPKLALSLYLRSFWYNIELKRFRYLVGFPFLLLAQSLSFRFGGGRRVTHLNSLHAVMADKEI